MTSECLIYLWLVHVQQVDARCVKHAAFAIPFVSFIFFIVSLPLLDLQAVFDNLLLLMVICLRKQLNMVFFANCI